MSILGLYNPAAFLEQVPTLFMALEEDYAFKTPVIFVYGIEGSAREFAPLYARQGGFKVKTLNFYDEEEETYYLNVYGCYMKALSKELIAPFNDEQTAFTHMLQGRSLPKNGMVFTSDNKAAQAWLKYKTHSPVDYSQCEN